MSLQVTDSRVHGIADHFLRAKLLSFLCVDSQADFLVVSRANLRCFALNPNACVGRRPRLTPALQEAGVEGFLLDYLSVPPAIADAFQEYTMAHLCLICRPDLSPQQEERMQQIARQELRQQGCPSQELIYYLGAQAHRLKQSAYDARGFVHSVTNVPRRPPVLRLLQQQQQQQQGPEEEQRQQQQLQQQEETIHNLRRTEQLLEEEQRQLEAEEMQQKETRDMLREHLLTQQADAEEEQRLRERIAAAAAAAAAEDQRYRRIASEVASFPSIEETLRDSKKRRLGFIKEQLLQLSSAARHLLKARVELEPFKGKAAAHQKEAEKLRAEEQQIQQTEEEVTLHPKP